MENQCPPHATCLPHATNLVVASLFDALRSSVDTDASSVYQAADDTNPIRETGMSKAHDHYLPSGFYDALENPISEEEYWRQMD